MRRISHDFRNVEGVPFSCQEMIVCASTRIARQQGGGREYGGEVLPSVGIDLKELGGQMSKCLKFCTGIEILNRFSLKK